MRDGVSVELLRDSKQASLKRPRLRERSHDALNAAEIPHHLASETGRAPANAPGQIPGEVDKSRTGVVVVDPVYDPVVALGDLELENHRLDAVIEWRLDLMQLVELDSVPRHDLPGRIAARESGVAVGRSVRIAPLGTDINRVGGMRRAVVV